MQTNHYPDYWKLAHVISLFKKDDPYITSNYRPVSLLSCSSKGFERTLSAHPYNFLYSNNIYYKYQDHEAISDSQNFRRSENYCLSQYGD